MIVIHKTGPGPRDNCRNCAHSVDPTQSYGHCLRGNIYIHDVMRAGVNCDVHFKGWVQKRWTPQRIAIACAAAAVIVILIAMH